ncbi:MAG: entericidin A/B family lipoprotein [Paraglaciecola polaris]|uniref:entericidin A/B family lipoprotein n=1 Tax=Paraglaciecola polaris TaxID=222814 RepID=UPI003002863A
MKTKLISTLKTLINSAALVAILVLGLTSCATIDGAGHDIESAGEAVQDAANE